MRSALETLTKEERKSLVGRLHEVQNKLCYICSNVVDLGVHKVDVDHIQALSRGGVDDEQNWALTHSACNRAKGARDLELQRILHTFKVHVEKHMGPDSSGVIRNFTLGNALAELHPDRQHVGVVETPDGVQLSFNIDGQPRTEVFPLLVDPAISDFPSFVGMLPFECLYHDPDINPRSIVDLEPMIEEFYNNNPQLQPSLATLNVEGGDGTARILLFDGQHKAAAQMYVGNPRLFVRVFFNCDKGRLKGINFRAHTRLAQIHFPQLVEDRVGDDLFLEEFERFSVRTDRNRKSERSFFREHLPQPLRSEYKKYFASHLRYQVLTGTEGTRPNDLLSYVETIVARSKRYPLSYETVRKTFLRHFLFLKAAAESLELSSRMRELERDNLVRLMNAFVDEVLAGNRFDLGKGIYRIEERLKDTPEQIPDSHLRAYRLCRASAMIVWSEELMRAIALLLNTLSRYEHSSWPKSRPLWARVEAPEWDRIRRMIRVVRDHKIWGERSNLEMLNAFSSTKQKDWQEILLSGRLPGRQEAMLPKLDQNYIFQSSQ